MVFHVLWMYTVAPEQAAAFERAYGPAGPWVRLFATGTGYVGTELFRSVGDPARYLTIDRWLSEEAYDAFRRAHADAYARIDAECAALTLSESRLGSFEG